MLFRKHPDTIAAEELEPTRKLTPDEVLEWRRNIVEDLRSANQVKCADIGPDKEIEIKYVVREPEALLELYKRACDRIYETISDYCKTYENVPPEKLFGEFPTRKESAQESTLEQKLHILDEKLQTQGVVAASIIGFFGGAAGAGYLTDIITDIRPVLYAASAIGSVFGAIGTGILGYLSFVPFIRSLQKKLNNAHKFEDEQFLQQVERYIQANTQHAS